MRVEGNRLRAWLDPPPVGVLLQRRASARPRPDLASGWPDSAGGSKGGSGEGRRQRATAIAAGVDGLGGPVHGFFFPSFIFYSINRGG